MERASSFVCFNWNLSFYDGLQEQHRVIQEDTCTPMFTAALLTTARTRKQPKLSSRGRAKEDAVYTMGYSSDTKRREIWSFTEMWMDLETVLWSKASKKEKNKYPM